MFTLEEIKTFCLKELMRTDDKATLLDVYYIMLKRYGKSYVRVRSTWIQYHQRQLRLFNAKSNFDAKKNTERKG